ncbi:MAG: 4-(cytidine 5'-diphospho)-2-C-methyl-D-erythritol kinase [Deltaproteobacteria bacterium]|nr:4-(cytidine 5'-diphospho)-2-C-methyl-D-erythritol kinase [Deltaproteobacteria bacterium]
MKSITLLSPAKINLTLEVLERRTDGYHEIRSIMQPVNLFDEVKVEIEEGKGVEIESTGLKIPQGEENIAWKAADIFIKEKGFNIRVKVSINKKIPLGAGLGGGSSNASAVLVGLNRITKRLSEDELLKLSPRIGADVAFFIHCRSAIAQGIGEKITLLNDFPLLYYILINPGFEVSTKKIYELCDRIDRKILIGNDMESIISLFKKGEFPLRNDLEKPALILYPEIEELKKRLIGMEVKAVSMTGSGPTVFGVFRNEKKARIVYDYLKDSNTFKTFLVQGISGWHRL